MFHKVGKLTALVLFVTLVPASSLGAAEIGAPVETFAVNRALATGNFVCDITTIDPPEGTGAPTGFAVVHLRNLIGVVSTGGEIAASANLGSGDGVDAICQALTEQLFSRSSALGCTTGPIRTIDHTGGNFTETTREFDFVCVNAERRVVETIGALFGDVITTPSAARLVKRTGLERREPAPREQVRLQKSLSVDPRRP